MADYDMSGIISKNKYKKLDKQPDITGKATINGQEMMVAGWAKSGNSGPYYALKFTVKDDEPKKNQSNSKEDLDDHIPF
jgi:hypothetical protein